MGYAGCSEKRSSASVIAHKWSGGLHCTHLVWRLQ
jgi:hypothetical protein